MKFYQLNSLVGVPIGAPTKNITPVTGDGLLSVGSSLAGSTLGSVLGISSQNSANKANLQIARENNEAQYKMFKEANAFSRQERIEAEKFNRNMWLEQQRYNDPSAQAARLSAAGLNAGNLLGGDAAQSVGSVASSSPASSVSPPTMQSAHIEPLVSASEIGGLANNFASAVKLMNEANAVSIDNQTKAERNIVEIETIRESIKNMLENRKLSKAQRRYLGGQLDSLNYEIQIQKFNLDHLQDSWNMTNEQHQKMMQQFDDAHNRATLEQRSMQLAYDLENTLGRSLRNWQIKKLQSEVSKAVAEIGLLGAQTGLASAQTGLVGEQKGLIKAQTGLTSAQRNKTYAEKAKIIAEKIGIDKQNKHFDNVVSDIEATLHLQGQQANYEYGMNNTFGGSLVRDIKHFGHSVVKPLSPFSGIFK